MHGCQNQMVICIHPQVFPPCSLAIQSKVQLLYILMITWYKNGTEDNYIEIFLYCQILVSVDYSCKVTEVSSSLKIKRTRWVKELGQSKSLNPWDISWCLIHEFFYFSSKHLAIVPMQVKNEKCKLKYEESVKYEFDNLIGLLLSIQNVNKDHRKRLLLSFWQFHLPYEAKQIFRIYFALQVF